VQLPSINFRILITTSILAQLSAYWPGPVLWASFVAAGVL
jgi:hypothetical protein